MGTKVRIITKSRYVEGQGVVYADAEHPAKITLDESHPEDSELYDPATFRQGELLPHYAPPNGPHGKRASDIQSVPLAEQAERAKKANRPSDKSPV